MEFSEDGQVMSFVRRGMRPDDVMYVVCNFGLKDAEYSMPVLADGRYREVFSSDNQKFGGEGNNNRGYKSSADGRIMVTAPALSFAVFAHVNTK